MTPGITPVSMSSDMINWVWCEDCLEWKNAGEDVAFISIDEDKFGKEVMAFTCDKCENDNKNNVISAPVMPRGG